MFASNSIINSGSAKKINLFCLLAAIVIILVLPLKKEIWYDETVSILCSKGISHDSPAQFSNTNLINSATLEQLNNTQNVFNATVNDNANSFLYNIGLHWFTLLFGNSITIYMLFSKLSGIITLLAFYVLCTLLFRNSLFTSVAILLLATDNNFTGMSHEIRAYSMGICFVTLAAVYFFKFMYQKENTRYLFLTSLFSVAAILSHFLTVYTILVFLAVLIFTKKTNLFSARNIIGLLLPVSLLALFFYFAYPGLQTMSVQNQHIQERTLNESFNVGEVLLRSMKFTAINFKAVFPAFINKSAVFIFSFLLVIALYIAGLKASSNKIEKRNLHLLFILGISSSLLLAVLSIKSHHYTALYYRYYSFCIPFCCLFVAYLFSVFFRNPKINLLIKSCIFSIIVLPVCALFLSGIISSKPKVRYNHIAIAGEIARDKVVKIEVPEWEDAFLIQSFLPNGYKIDYVLNPTNHYFTLYKGTTEEKIPVIKDNL
jgi:uncharacterized membrane protein